MIKKIYIPVVDCDMSRFAYTDIEKAKRAAKRMFKKAKNAGHYPWLPTFESAILPDKEGFALIEILSYPVK